MGILTAKGGASARARSNKHNGAIRSAADARKKNKPVVDAPRRRTTWPLHRAAVENDYLLTRWYGADFGEREVVVEHISDNGGDGVALDVDGRYYVAAKRTNTVVIFDRGGKLLDTLALPPGAGALITNLCFGGDDLRTLFVTDSHRRLVVAFDGMPTTGLPLHRWPSQARAIET